MARTKSPKRRTWFVCRECGSSQSRWMGRCPDCEAWNSLESFVETADDAAPPGSVVDVAGGDDGGRRGGGPGDAAKARPIVEIEAPSAGRWPTGIGELDRVLGGGLVPASVVLLGGDPGIGKSTLLMQAAAALAGSGRRILYATSEESAWQTRLRAERLIESGAPGAGGDDPAPGSAGSAGGLDHLYVLADTHLGRIVAQAREVRPDVVVVDSVQMLWSPSVESAPGSVSQVRHCAAELVRLAKATGAAVIVVGHVTKEGGFAGPKLLEHLVDVVLTFEGDRHHAHRVVRGVKNRHGTTLEVGLFEMTGHGLREVIDAGPALDPAARPEAGSVVCPAVHGSRSILVEVQALTATGFPGSVKRRASGLDPNRLAMLVAVLEQHGGMRLADQDVLVQAAGGLRVNEPGADGAVLLAVAGAHLRRRVPPRTAVAAEVGLGGELRPVSRTEERAREAVRRGFERIVVAEGGPDLPDGAVAVPVRRVSDAIALLETAATHENDAD